MRVASRGFEEVNGFGQTAETVFAGQPPEQAEEAPVGRAPLLLELSLREVPGRPPRAIPAG